MTDEPADLAELLELRRDYIVSRFVSEVQRKRLSPPHLAASVLLDDIPSFLDDVVVELRRVQHIRTTHDVIDTSAVARKHGEQRWQVGYDVEALVREYGVLRHCIVETAKEARVNLSVDEFQILAKCLSVGVAEAVQAYVRYRDEQLDAQKANLEFLVEAGRLLSSSLDYRSTLHRLSTLIVPRLADCCVIHVDGDGDGPDDVPIVHAANPRDAELIREIYKKYPLREDSAFGYPAVRRSGEPQLVPEVNRELLRLGAQSPEHLTLLEELGVGSWLILPLRVQETMSGALALSYTSSGRRYGSQDLVLGSELASRAAVAIDNARLYELSQRERSRVETATRIKDEFVAMVSHELRTPLNAILGWIRLLRGGALDETKRAHALDVIERNADAQNRLVGDLLDISRALAGKIRINPSQLNLADVIDMAVEGIRPAADAKRITLELDVAPDNGVMRGDSDRLQQVVWNLLVNAVKFTPKHGKVRIELRRVESDLELTVSDDGIGIEAEFLPQVFDSFRQWESAVSRRHGGLGIGLSITKHIVELHGGFIEAKSAGRGQGSTFKVRLPVSPLVSTTLGVGRVPATNVPSPETVLPSGPKGMRVLVVDDEPDARELVTYVLESCGMEVRSAGSAAEALSELERFTPQVILSDIGMAEEDGYSLIRKIRTLGDEQKRNVPAIALTAFARNEDRTRALVAGFNVHMAKPVEPAALVQAVTALGIPT